MIYLSILSTFSSDGSIWWNNKISSLDLTFMNVSWLLTLALFTLLILILLGVSTLLNQIGKWEKQHQAGILKERKDLYELQRPSVNLSDVVIPEEEKERLREFLATPAALPPKKIKAPIRNVIISGPAGCGKSLIAHAIAG